MFTSYLRSALRNISKNKFFSGINILGLSIGLACCILMYLFIQNELSYDRFHKHATRIYRITSIADGPNGKSNLAVTPAPWAPIMKKDFPEIQQFVRVLKDEKSNLGEKGKPHFNEADLLYADSTFFDVFSFSLKEGNQNAALQAPNSIVLTRTAAKKYFGDQNAIGKTLEVNSFGRNFTVQVTAIADDLPANSHMQFNGLISLQTLGDISNLWAFHMFQSYLLVNTVNESQQLQHKFPDFVKKYIANNPQADGMQEIFLQPLTSIHLHSQMTGELGVNGDSTYVYVFTGIAMFILLIACFNFTNLSTARSITRAKEVGLRKVAGALKPQLIKQFLGETVIVALISLLIAIGLARLALPLLNQLAERQLELNLFKNYQLLLLFVALIAFVGILAGLYPAAVLSAFRPIEVLKGKFKSSGKGVSFRKGLVTLQFVVSIALVACTILVMQQLRYLKNKDVGFEKDNVMIVPIPGNSDSTKLQTLKNNLAINQKIKSLAAASSVPGTFVPINQVNDGNIDLTKAVSMQMLFTDPSFVSTMKMKIIAGRDFSDSYATDRSSGFLINEEAVKKLGWSSPEQAIGKPFQWVQPTQVLKSGTVIGVVKNFNITPLKSAIQPLVMHYNAMRFRYLYVRFQQADARQLISSIEKNYKSIFPEQTFEYSFLDDTLNSLYAREANLGRIFTSFSFLAIFIACLGILGLSLYSIQQRVKEIGIRKVLGASVAGISTELIKDFVKPVLIAAIIATPIAWYAMNRWLEAFAYKIQISPWVFVITTLMVLMIALLTMSIQSVKAALSNPVKSLRTE